MAVTTVGVHHMSEKVDPAEATFVQRGSHTEMGAPAACHQSCSAALRAVGAKDLSSSGRIQELFRRGPG